MHTHTSPKQKHESNLSLNSLDNTFHEIQTDIIAIDDLNVPITLKKGVRACTQHPIYYNFVSYDGLSPKYWLLPLILPM